MMYELWHLASGNLLEDFATESEAIEAVREYLEANGVEMLRELSLSAVPTDADDAHAALPPTLAGEELAARIGIRRGAAGRAQ